jgi:TetR/AcrR family transcriptional regulator, regulator of cefoperazone and chloramphenicol sensitivity
VSSVPLVSEDLGRGAQARQALVRAAVEVFGESGLQAATTREIAQRAQQNIAAIAYYFGGKEALYLAVVEHIVEVIMARIGPVMDEAEAFLDQGGKPQRALSYLTRLLELSIATNQSIMPLTGIIVREQTQPTKAFSILYQGCLERLQRLGAALIRAYLGKRAHEEECIVRFHAMLGEALAFRFARETVLRRAGWKQIGPAEESIIRSVVTQHAALVLRGLRRSHAPKRRTGREAS